jgi:hypothetical protein
MPKELKPGMLYLSEEFKIGVHLCPCGCGSKIRTPIGLTAWTFTETADGPTLWPSIGNWQLPCQSHYWITGGEVMWAPNWTSEQIAAGRQAEEQRHRAYYEELDRKRTRLPARIWRWLKSRFSRSKGDRW